MGTLAVQAFPQRYLISLSLSSVILTVLPNLCTHQKSSSLLPCGDWLSSDTESQACAMPGTVGQQCLRT